jgi:ketosteroid isomerase-like protein
VDAERRELHDRLIAAVRRRAERKVQHNRKKAMKQSMAKPVADYVAASNAFDTDAMLAAFKDDALVNDAQREFWGKETIRAFFDKELVGARVKMDVVKVVEHDGDMILTAKISKEGDPAPVGNPLVLTFYFSLRDGRISQLIILQNK